MRPMRPSENDEDAPTVQMSDAQRQLLVASFTPPTASARTIPEEDASIEPAVLVSPARPEASVGPSLADAVTWLLVGLTLVGLLGGAAVLALR